MSYYVCKCISNPFDAVRTVIANGLEFIYFHSLMIHFLIFSFYPLFTTEVFEDLYNNRDTLKTAPEINNSAVAFVPQTSNIHSYHLARLCIEPFKTTHGQALMGICHAQKTSHNKSNLGNFCSCCIAML